MVTHFPLNVKIKLETNFSLICAFLHNFENKSLIKLKQQNIVIDLNHRAEKKKEHQKKLVKKLK